MRRLVAVALLCSACDGDPKLGFDWAFFHRDRGRAGWNDAERTLTPASVGKGFKHLFDSPPFDHESVGGRDFAPHLYASLLYDDQTRSILAASSNGWVYAVSPVDGSLRWKLRLAPPYVVKDLDGGMALGVLGTPALDAHGRVLYLAAQSADTHAFAVFAVDVDHGKLKPGWPLPLDPVAIEAKNTNGPSTFLDPTLIDQRGALNLDPGGHTLYVPFGTTTDHGSGWLVAVDLVNRQVLGSFAVTPITDSRFSGGGIWGSGGAVVDERGDVWDTSGNSDETMLDAAHVWGSSLLQWDPTSLQLKGTYTPWNICQLETADADLGGSSPTLLPVLDGSATATPRLIAFGGKQGNVYLVDRDRLTGSLDRRPPCATDPSGETSLVPPSPQPQFGMRGPLNVFGPYSEIYGNRDQAKMRTTLAHFFDGTTHFLYAVGATKAAVDATASVPPSVARLKLVLSPGQPAYLALDATDSELSVKNPGPPVVSSNGGRDPIVWLIDENQRRVDPLTDPAGARPILYAVDGTTMKVLFKSGPADLQLSGKYNEPLVLGGRVYVGTDRVQAFGLR